ncbi:MAG: phosphoribosylformylglycinamidine synthase II, partial [Acidobacteria bacterium]|nr:phosphoribosylformylglycinamidine synthase II [Acidobacteriota bacterium]
IEDVRRIIQPGFKGAGDIIAILGETRGDTTVSEYAATILGHTTQEMIKTGRVPALDLGVERAVQKSCLAAAEAGLLRSAHDCSDGGLAVALAECCFSSLNRAAIGAEVDLTGTVSTTARLFSETPSRIIVSFEDAALGQIEEITAREGCRLTILGRAGGDRLSIRADGDEVISLPLAELENAWRTSLEQRLRAEVLVAGAE